MSVEGEVIDLLHRYQFPSPRWFFDVSTVDQHKGIMINGVDFPDIVLDADFRSEYFYVFRFVYACTDIYPCPVILSQDVSYADEEDFPVFIRKKVCQVLRHL